jgi:hypothetical protein
MPSVRKTTRVAGHEGKGLHVEGLARQHAEWCIDAELDLLHDTSAQAEGQGVPGADDHGRAGVQVHVQELTGDELAGRRVLGQAVVGVAGLLAEAQPLPAPVAQAADQQGGQQGRRDLMADRVGDRHLQEVAVEGVVEGVPPTAAAGSSHPARVNCPASQV